MVFIRYPINGVTYYVTPDSMPHSWNPADARLFTKMAAETYICKFKAVFEIMSPEETRMLQIMSS